MSGRPARVRSWTALAAFGLLALLATGCKKEHAPQGTAAAVPEAAPDARGNTTNGTATSEAPDGTRSASAAAVPTRIAGPAAFDLALVEGGALLAWSPPRAQGGGLYVQRLDARGNPREPARRLTQTDAGGEVIELAATGVGARVGVAWLE